MNALDFNDLLFEKLKSGSNYPYSETIKECILKFGLDEFKRVACSRNEYFWWFGNLAHYIITCVFGTALCFGRYNADIEDVNMHVLKNNNIQSRDALYALYYLFLYIGVSGDDLDYYDRTVRQNFMFTIGYSGVSDELRELIPAYKLLLKYGARVIDIQTNIILMWVEHNRKKKKDAAMKIANWWFDIITCPYNDIGKRYLSGIAEGWNKFI